jgi:hypothetical protein
VWISVDAFSNPVSLFHASLVANSSQYSRTGQKVAFMISELPAEVYFETLAFSLYSADQAADDFRLLGPLKTALRVKSR